MVHNFIIIMFYAIDKITNEIILSLNIRDRNYKDTYNKELRFRCAGSCDNGEECNDEKVVYVNSKLKQSHFRHSSGSKCSASKAFKEFNIDFYSNWFNLFKKEYRKPYWYNCKLEQIRDDNDVIIVRYAQQKSDTIKCLEKYSKNKVIWILSLEKRKYSDIKHYKGKIYVDFIGSKNDIPLYDDNKSEVYLDTDTDILLKVILNNTSCYGQEIECINIYDLCNKYEHLFKAYPYRKKGIIFRNLIKEQNKYIRQQELEHIEFKKHQEYLLIEYNKVYSSYIIDKDLEKFYILSKLYNRLSIPKPIEHNKKYCEYYTNLLHDMYNIKNYILNIKNKEKEIKTFHITSNCVNLPILQKICDLKSVYTSYFNIIENMKLKFTNIIYIQILSSKEYGYDIDLVLMNNNYNINLNLENKIINNILYDEYIKELDILLYENSFNIISYLEKQHKELNNKKYIDKQKKIKEKREEELLIQKNKDKEKVKKHKERQLKKNLEEKKQDEYENELVENKLDKYSQEYNLKGTQLIPKLLDIININYEKIKSHSYKSNDDLKYINKYYIWITFPLNHNIDKMILYIIEQEKYL